MTRHHEPVRRHVYRNGLAVGFCALCLAGCATTPPEAEPFPVASKPKVILQPGDVLQVKFLYWPELNEDQQAIRPDGKISLQLVGDVHAEGLAPDELRNLLLEQYEDKLIDPEISVVVNALDSHRVYVGGEVISPGLVMIQGELTALGAIMQAGGPRKTSAKLNSVVIVRQSGGRQYGTTIDLREALKSSESDPFMLAPGDIVYVPRTAIDRVDQWVDQYINQIIPRNLHYNFTHQINQKDTNNRSGLASELISNMSSASPPQPGVLSSGSN